MLRRSFLQTLILSVAHPSKNAGGQGRTRVAASQQLRPSSEELKVDIEQLKLELDESGLVIIPEVLPRNDALRAAEILRDLMRRESKENNADQHLRGVFNYLEPAYDEVFLPLVAHPICLELAKYSLGEGFQMAEVGARWRKPGSAGTEVYLSVPLDWMVSSGLPVPSNTCFLVTFSWMLTDLTRDIGATFYVPYSHHTTRAPKPGRQYKYQVAAEGPAGSLVIRPGGLWHSFGPNQTRDKERVGLMGGYFARWMDPTSVDWRLMKKSVRERLPANIRAMNRHVVEG